MRVAGIFLFLLPLLEWWLMVRLRIPVAIVVLWCGFTAVVGVYVKRGEDLVVLISELTSDWRNGRLPTNEAVEALLIQVAGWGLIIPGLLTDIVAGILLIPHARDASVGLFRLAWAHLMPRTYRQEE